MNTAELLSKFQSLLSVVKSSKNKLDDLTSDVAAANADYVKNLQLATEAKTALDASLANDMDSVGMEPQDSRVRVS